MEENLNLYRREQAKPVKRRNPYLYFWLVPLFATIILLLFSVLRSGRTVMRLSADPPAEFLTPRPEWDVKRRQTEQQLARKYWESAVKVVQWQYAYGSPLPPKPPAEFRIDPRVLPNPAAATAESRDYYWQRLRVAWPDAWEEVYIWDTSWISHFIEQLRSKIPSLFGVLVL